MIVQWDEFIAFTTNKYFRIILVDEWVSHKDMMHLTK
jgi:hypothetical protein